MASKDFQYLLDRVEEVLSLTEKSEDPVLWDLRLQLETLRCRLRDLILRPDNGLVEPIEIEFYALLQKHPKLQKAFLAGITGELIHQCHRALGYFSDLERKRPLTPQEASRRTEVREELQTYEKEYEDDKN